MGQVGSSQGADGNPRRSAVMAKTGAVIAKVCDHRLTGSKVNVSES